MKGRRPSVVMLSLIAIAAALSAGCEADFVGTAARSSITSFVTTVLTTGVTEALNPTD